ncbi:MAG: GDP-mannose 4,6-dehydratase, partial [Acidobacteria bacterium]|nr:GDP-mannose 4,6-dehydratase [Acidobacteriota bacterium]
LESEFLVGDASKAHERLGWKPTVSFEQLVREMVESDIAFFREALPDPTAEVTR